MTLDQALAFAIILGTMGLLIWGRIRYDLVALLALAVAIACGIVKPDEAFRGFSDDIVIIVGSALVVSAALGRSGLVETLMKPLVPRMRTSVMQVAVLASAVTALSAFIKNIGALAIFIPIAVQVARRTQKPASRVLITSHDAFNYLGRAYGFQVVGVQGISTVTEAGLADIVKVTDFIKQKGVKAVFIESSVPRAAMDRISKDSGARIGGELFSDAVGTPGKTHTVAGETYDEGTVVGMLKHNINTVVEALK